MYDATTWFLQCFWLFISHFEVSSCTPRCKEVRGKKKISARFARRMYPHFQKRGAALASVMPRYDLGMLSLETIGIAMPKLAHARA